MKYIFEVKIKKGHSAEEYAAAWKHGSKIIQKKNGAHGTHLHRKIGDNKKQHSQTSRIWRFCKNRRI